jgi:hypothetical protein
MFALSLFNPQLSALILSKTGAKAFSSDGIKADKGGCLKPYVCPFAFIRSYPLLSCQKPGSKPFLLTG